MSTNHRSTVSSRCVCALLFTASAVLAQPLGATTFLVDTPVDLPDGNVLDNICSWMADPDPNVPTCTLRAAVMQANAIPVDPNAPVIAIQLKPTEQYFIGGATNHSDVSGTVGDLDISRPMAIGVAAVFSKARISNLQNVERLFHVHTGAAGTRLFGLRMKNFQGGGDCVLRAETGAGALDLDHIEILDSPCNGAGALSLFNTPTFLRDSTLHHGSRAISAFGAALTVERTTFHSNDSDVNLSTIWLNDSTATFVHSTFSGNDQPIEAYISNLFVIGSTFVDSKVEHITFKTDNPDQLLRISNSLFSTAVEPSCAYYTAGSVPVDIAGSVDVSGSVFDDLSCVPNNNVPVVENLYDAIVSTKPLGDRGGPTQTHELLPNSDGIDWIPPAFCNANGTEQRGFPRAIAYSGQQPAHCDAGATELQLVPPGHIFGDGFEGD